MHIYEVRPRRANRGFDLISNVLPFGRLWYAGPNAAGYAIIQVDKGRPWVKSF
jgi:hypothetical protein